MISDDLRRHKKLEELQEIHSQLVDKKKHLKKTLSTLTNEMAILNREIKRVGSQIFDLKNVNEGTPHITDHAVVRYLERVKGVDIWELKSEIADHKESVRVKNTIVTVYDKDSMWAKIASLEEDQL